MRSAIANGVCCVVALALALAVASPVRAQVPNSPEAKEKAPAATMNAPAMTETPLYKKWWLWTAVGVVVVVGVGIGLAVGLSSSNNTPSAATDFGTYKPF